MLSLGPDLVDPEEQVGGARVCEVEERVRAVGSRLIAGRRERRGVVESEHGVVDPGVGGEDAGKGRESGDRVNLNLRVEVGFGWRRAVCAIR